MLATPSHAAQAHRVLGGIGVTIGTPEYAAWQAAVKRKARERTQAAIHGR